MNNVIFYAFSYILHLNNILSKTKDFFFKQIPWKLKDDRKIYKLYQIIILRIFQHVFKTNTDIVKKQNMLFGSEYIIITNDQSI